MGEHDDLNDLEDFEIDRLLESAHDFDENDEERRSEVGEVVSVPDIASRNLFAHSKRKGARVIFLGEHN